MYIELKWHVIKRSVNKDLKHDFDDINFASGIQEN